MPSVDGTSLLQKKKFRQWYVYIPMFAIHNIFPSNEDVAKCMESLMKYQSLANNMFISEHTVCLSQAHDKEQQIMLSTTSF